MGYLLPTVTQAAFLNQQDVVQNETRQGYDNVPYGHTAGVIGKLLYPEDHPYSWTVIGSFEDLANATIEDIREFFRIWYGPNNATLVVAGDFDVVQTREWIEQYFGEIPASPTMADPEPRAVTLTETKRAFHEDNFARSPELNMMFPTVEQFHPDAYPLELLGLLISDGKSAPLYQTIVEEEQLAPAARAVQYAPNVSHLTIAGDIGKTEAIELFRPLEQKWAAKEVTVSSYVDPTPAEEPAVYVVDIPQARQSEFRIGHLALPYDHPDYYATSVMNHALGGSFNGRVNLILREEKGDTYGARSSFSGSSYPGTFMASAGVRSNVTLESVQIFKDELEKFREGVADEELAFTQGALIQGNARRFETLGALRAMLGTYSLPFDYIQDQEQVVQDMTLERHQELARMYIRPRQMIYLIVGDAETQVERLEELGLGVPIMLDRNGKASDTKATVERSSSSTRCGTAPARIAKYREFLIEAFETSV